MGGGVDLVREDCMRRTYANGAQRLILSFTKTRLLVTIFCRYVQLSTY